MTQPDVTLISYGHFEFEFLSKLADSIHAQFKSHVEIAEEHIELIDYYDPRRRQYDGNKLLGLVSKLKKKESEKVIGLFDVDLFIPILTFIYGQAELSGSIGIASMYRLKNQRYGLKSDTDLHLARFAKEVIHELGHTFGLIHCFQPQCVMRSSTYVEDIDQKDAQLCLKCRAELKMDK